MLEVGDKAPDFTATDAQGNTVRLADYAGRKLVLYFYPKDNTPGCTSQACDFRDNYHRFQAQGYAILGVSRDTAESHKRFAQKYDLPFPLLVDTDLALLKAYDAWGEKTMYGKTTMGTLRKTYVIDENGIIRDIVKKVNTKAPTAQILKEQTKEKE